MQEARILLAVQDIPVLTDYGHRPAKAFWDTGATICLCTREWAERMGLQGTPTPLYLKVIQHLHEAIDSKKYEFELMDVYGNYWQIRAFGVDTISREAPFEPTGELRTKYPDLNEHQLRRRGGEVDVFLGMDVIGMFPVPIQTMGNQRVLSTNFGVGKLLVGCVPGVETHQISAAASRLAKGSWEKPTVGVIHLPWDSTWTTG